MSEKAKRKGNPRRRYFTLGILFNLTILVIGALIIYGRTANLDDTLPIIYHIPDEYGSYGTLWQMQAGDDVQLLDTPIYMRETQILGDRVFYHTESGDYGILYLDTGATVLFEFCPEDVTCQHVSPSPAPSGSTWIAYTTPIIDEDPTIAQKIGVQIWVYDIGTDEASFVAEYSPQRSGNHHYDLYWVLTENSPSLVFPQYMDIEASIDSYSLYNPVLGTIENNYLRLPISSFTTSISDNGKYYMVGPEGVGKCCTQVSGIEVFETISHTALFREETVVDDDLYLNWYAVEDWHPDGDYMLTTIEWRDYDLRDSYVSVEQVNIHTGEAITLVNRAFYWIYSASYNRAGTHVILDRIDRSNGEQVLMMFDLRTGEETIIPLAARYPLWID